jgi:hypothetical protein
VIGILYSAPPFGQALGPIVGGALSQMFSWRINFCPVPALLGIYLLLFVFFFRDTFRKERSLTYRRAVARHNATAQRKAQAIRKSQIQPVIVIVTTTVCGDPGAQAALGGAETTKEVQTCLADRRKSVPPIPDAAETGVQTIAPSLADVNPFPNMYRVVKRLNNSAVLLSSGTPFFKRPPFSPMPCLSESLTHAHVHRRYSLRFQFLHPVHGFPNSHERVPLQFAPNRTRAPLRWRREHIREHHRRILF